MSDCTEKKVVNERLLAIVLSAALMACSQSSTDRSPGSTLTIGVKPLYANSTTRYFSSENRMDTLNVAVNGESLITGEVYLRITNFKGKSIFSTTFPASALLNHDGLINPKRDEKAIKNRIDHFFEATHFVSPIAAKPELSSTSDSTKAAWRTIETDPKAIYFSYQSSKGSVSQIAYSKSLGKVIRL